MAPGACEDCCRVYVVDDEAFWKLGDGGVALYAPRVAVWKLIKIGSNKSFLLVKEETYIQVTRRWCLISSK